MKEGHASRTAELMALFRALESNRPKHQRLFNDPFARYFLNWPLSLLSHLLTIPGAERIISGVVDRKVPGARSSAVARTKLIDDANEAAVTDGIEQFVILGGGFDCRAYRLQSLQGVQVFEVDHPDTQAAKRATLERLGVVPQNVRFVAIDFNKEQLATVMPAAGFRESVRTFFLWEGVTNYLSEVAVDTTLRWCAQAPKGSRVLFTYVHRNVLNDPGSFVGTEKLFASLERYGEKWTFGLEPSELREFLQRRCLSLESDLGAADYRERFYGNAAHEMRGYEFYRIALAHVGEGSRLGPSDSAPAEANRA